MSNTEFEAAKKLRELDRQLLDDVHQRVLRLEKGHAELARLNAALAAKQLVTEQRYDEFANIIGASRPSMDSNRSNHILPPGGPLHS